MYTCMKNIHLSTTRTHVILGRHGNLGQITLLYFTMYLHLYLQNG